jgi:hypothetical protein
MLRVAGGFAARDRFLGRISGRGLIRDISNAGDLIGKSTGPWVKQ